MVDESEGESALFPERVGDKLRTARLAAGLDLSDIATKTRVPLRHLSAIEAGDYASLPSSTYCVGFAKAFARAVGEDEAAIASQLRQELGQQPPDDRYEPTFVDEEDSGPVPSRKLAITAVLIAVLLTAGYAFWRSSWSAETLLEPVAEDTSIPARPTTALAAAPAPSNQTGEVVLTAKDAVWLRIYDASDKVLFEKEMKAGERFAVPADANNPMIRTGRADLVSVSVGGREVAALGPAERTIKDVGVSAAALAARPIVSDNPSALSNSAAPNAARQP